MTQFFTAAEIAEAEGTTLRQINRLVTKQGWRRQADKARKRPGRGGGWEYHLSLLSDAARARLAASIDAVQVAVEPDRSQLWQDFESLSKDRKAACERRLKVVDAVDELMRGGMAETASITYIAKQYDVASRSIRSWRKKVAHVDRADRLPALADSYKQTSRFSECHPDAWAALKSDFLRPEKPSFSACYRRVKEAAEEHGWYPIPNAQSLRRRFKEEVPEAVVTLAREGRDKAKTLYPAQRRDRSGLHAMQAVNMDGHRFDVFIQIDGKETADRIHLIALQDLYSGKIVSWRLSKSESKDVVRLVIGDMVERHGIPEKILLDNGRAFASKWITGKTPNRYRFKIRDEDPQGLLTALGLHVVWATPYAGQSKPIERAFRDLCDDIARHPFCAGAYTGNRPENKPANYGSRAIPLADFSSFVETMIAEHNARTGRTGGNAHGRSFDQTFSQSLAEPTTLIRWPTIAQRTLWLMAAERIRAQRGSGEIHLFGNRYWSVELNSHAGQMVTVRFDPDHLTKPMHVYDLDDRLICVADCIADTGFFDTAAARNHAAKRNALMKNLREGQRLHAELSPVALAELYSGHKEPPTIDPEPPIYKKVATASGASVTARRAEWDEENEANFSRAVNALTENVLEFPERGKGGR